jgi:hypothetical protein
MEEHIVVVSDSVARLTMAAFGMRALAYPLEWQHIFIPMLTSYVGRISIIYLT